ncbi:MAG: hypothetical protein NTX61_01400 [Bacteroidetes bacterium]|nr:hypothetical protein [Bacteroidota bacterium]
MKKFCILTLLSLLVTSRTGAQTGETKTPLFGISFSGYVKTDLIYDSRQTINLREGHFLLYPDAVLPDATGKDINAKGSFNILSIQTRLAGTITGTDALGAKTSGYIEAEFFGSTNANINSFRLRHAWVKLNWPSTELLVGQYWHPMFVPACAPEPVSFNTGAPFVVFSRNPQVRLTQAAGKFKFQLTALEQLDFMSTGPDGTSPKYLRNSIIPELNFQVQFATKNEANGTEFLAGIGINYIVITPQLANTVTLKKAYDTVVGGIVVHHNAVTTSYSTNQKIGAISENLFMKLRIPHFTFKLGALYGQNTYSYTMLGGYVVKSVTDPATGAVDYANISVASGWVDLSTNGKKVAVGILGAYCKNLGAGTTVAGPAYTRGANIDYLYRIAPRLILNVNKFRFAPEIEYTVAAYGKTNEKALVSNSKEIGNWRVLIGVFYYF